MKKLALIENPNDPDRLQLENLFLRQQLEEEREHFQKREDALKAKLAKKDEMFRRLMAGAKDYAERCQVVSEDNTRLREELSEARALNQRLQEQNKWLQGDLTAEGDEQTLCKQLTEARAFTLKLQEQIRFLQEGIKDERNRNLASEQSLRERIAGY